jgi:catechol 2,3-dioxygenase-like lactoylglutathione lyase family enzyme
MDDVRAINHFSVSVADMDVSVAFWSGLLGLEVTGRGIVEYEHLNRIVGLEDTCIEWAELRIPGGGMIELFRYERPRGEPVNAEVNDPGCTHICLEVGDLDALLARLRAGGVESRSATPVEIPFGDWRGFKSVYVMDPDRVVVELVEPPGPLPE